MPYYSQNELTLSFLSSLARSGLEYYDLPVSRLTFIQHNASVVFQVDSLNGRRYSLKLHVSVVGKIYASPAQIRAKMGWLYQYKNSTGQMAQTPIPNREGDLITPLKIKPNAPEIVCTLQEWIDGVPVNGDFTLEQLSRIGRMAANMHQFNQVNQNAGMELPVYSSNEFAQGLLPFEGAVSDNLLSGQDLTAIYQASSHISRLLDQFQRIPSNWGPIHGDIHHENILLCGNEICLIDFDALRNAPFIYDLGVFLYHIHYQGLPARNAFLEAYQSIRSLENLPERWVDLVITWAAIDNLSFQVTIPEQKHSPLLQKNLDQLVHEFCPRFGAVN
jgi:Ser/Thr protein kinase RdoA (MazF antagonist)